MAQQMFTIANVNLEKLGEIADKKGLTKSSVLNLMISEYSEQKISDIANFMNMFAAFKEINKPAVDIQTREEG